MQAQTRNLRLSKRLVSAQRLKLKYVEPLSNFAFNNINLRPYIKAWYYAGYYTGSHSRRPAGAGSGPPPPPPPPPPRYEYEY